MREAVEALPPLQREAIVLFEYEEMSLVEIATIADADIGTIKSRLHRARERLRRSLAPWMTETKGGRGRGDEDMTDERETNPP